MYTSKLVYPVLSIFLRFSILIVMIILSFGLYYGIIAGVSVSSFYEFIVTMSSISFSFINAYIMDLIIQIIVVVILLSVFIAKNRLFTGLIKSIHAYIVVILMLSLASTILHSNNIDIPRYGIVFLTILVLNVIMWLKYPPIALSFKKIDEGSGTVIPINNPLLVVLKSSEMIRIDVIGNLDNIDVKYDENYVRVIEEKTITGGIILVKPLSTIESKIHVLYDNNLLSSFSVKLEETSTRKLEFRIIFNGDYLGNETYTVEETKNLLEAVYPVVKSVIARMGLTEDDIREIQFYDEEDKLLNPSLPIYKLPSNKVTIKIYSIEKHLEVLKYYREEDIYKLWDKLMKRLEYVNTISEKIIEKISKDVVLGKTILYNWW